MILMMGRGNIGKWFCSVWPTVRIFFGRIILLYMKIHFFCTFCIFYQQIHSGKISYALWRTVFYTKIHFFTFLHSENKSYAHWGIGFKVKIHSFPFSLVESIQERYLMRGMTGRNYGQWLLIHSNVDFEILWLDCLKILSNFSFFRYLGT